MPKLTNHVVNSPSIQGSVLAPVILFSFIITICIGGFLGVARTVVNGEVTALTNDKAFLAAESGLLLGEDYVRKNYQPNTFTTQTDIFGTALRDAQGINGMNVTVDITVNGTTVTVSSLAQNAVDVSYKKLLSKNLIMTPSSLASGAYGVYLKNAYKLGGNTQGIRKMNWDGPAHFNTALQLGNPGKGNETQFNDRVTLFNIDPSNNLSVSNAANGTGHFGNDYRFGVEGGSGNWDQEFQAIYNPFSERVIADLDTANKINVVFHGSDSSLTFGINAGTPYYQYKNAAGTTVQTTYNHNNNLLLHIVNNGAQVSGLLKGKVSVYTDAGKNIYLPGNLTFEDFSSSSFSSSDKSSNADYGWGTSNVAGLFSGGDIIVESGTHNITAQLFAVNNGALLFSEDQKNKTTLNLFGTLAVDNFWDSKQGNDQATFLQKWDRRSLSAPGLSFKKIDGFGQTIITSTCVSTNWTEKNFQ